MSSDPFIKRQLRFFLTAPNPCPYLPGLQERKIFTHLASDDGGALNDALTHGGFRRSQTIAYRPACEGCNACTSARIPVADFSDSRSWARVRKRNTDITVHNVPALATQEQYSLLAPYLDTRHTDGGMNDMSFLDYVTMVEDTPVRTHLTEYRLPSPTASRRVIAVPAAAPAADGWWPVRWSMCWLMGYRWSTASMMPLSTRAAWAALLFSITSPKRAAWAYPMSTSAIGSPTARRWPIRRGFSPWSCWGRAVGRGPM